MSRDDTAVNQRLAGQGEILVSGTSCSRKIDRRCACCIPSSGRLVPLDGVPSLRAARVPDSPSAILGSLGSGSDQFPIPDSQFSSERTGKGILLAKHRSIHE